MNDQASAPTFRDLPFIADDAWTPGETGAYGTDCQLGRAHAQLLIDTMREHDQPTMYGAVIRCIVLSGKTGGVEIGFHQCIAEHLL